MVVKIMRTQKQEQHNHDSSRERSVSWLVMAAAVRVAELSGMSHYGTGMTVVTVLF